MNDRIFKAYLIACFTYLVGASTYLVLQERERVLEEQRTAETNKRLYEEAQQRFLDALKLPHPIVRINDVRRDAGFPEYVPVETKRKWWKR